MDSAYHSLCASRSTQIRYERSLWSISLCTSKYVPKTATIRSASDSLKQMQPSNLSYKIKFAISTATISSVEVSIRRWFNFTKREVILVFIPPMVEILPSQGLPNVISHERLANNSQWSIRESDYPLYSVLLQLPEKLNVFRNLFSKNLFSSPKRQL